MSTLSTKNEILLIANDVIVNIYVYNEVTTACAVNLLYTSFAVQGTGCELYQD